MSDEPTRRLVGPLRPSFGLDDRSELFATVSESPSGHPESFPDREGPTLASPSSQAISTRPNTEQRLVKALDRIQQLEADLKSLNAQVMRLGERLETERRRSKAARVGRYLLWGALIAAMATFWMMLHLHFGSR